MELSALLRGLVLGFSIAAPVGPIGVLVIRRSLAEGRRVGREIRQNVQNEQKRKSGGASPLARSRAAAALSAARASP